MRDPFIILKEYWGYDSFRPLQKEIIDSILQGNDTLALMPTGGGKSLCYQVPALMMDGLCLVISPLIALMKDQVENLRKKNITALAIYSGMTRHEVMNALKVAANSNCKFLYVSPERLETSLFREYLPGLGVSLVAVDEAHCVSQWGYDFRPPYLRIAALREELQGIPILALTASATPEVQDDICKNLSGPSHGPGWKVFRQSFERPNLSYSVFQVDSKVNKLLEILKNVPGSSIVYAKSRKKTKEVCDLLGMNGISADFYHAGLGPEDRNRKQQDWVTNNTRVIVCTNAFGMGIDKPDVRSVIHVDIPDCLENYYQEAGRAGRDGKRSYAVLLYAEKDVDELASQVGTRYPPLEDIRRVYHAIANYLQIGAGSGEGQYFDFDLNDFVKKFKLDGTLVIYALKALEQDGWLSFNEQVFRSSRVQFVADKNYLYQFEKDKPGLEPLIKALLRSYEGLFEYPASISELLLARLLKTENQSVKRQLAQLQSFRIIDYEPQKESPQLFFTRNRIRAEDLSIDLKLFNQRKDQFEARTKVMIRYIHEPAKCRSRVIGSYFGDDKVRDCGICDNCLGQKSIHLSREEFNFIHERIIESIKHNKLQSKELIQKLSDIKKEKAWKVLSLLQAESKIEIDKSGWIKLK